ncbi:hypothetical protein QBC38DRAFT_490978 [Podospora fimiseda]|uniref:DNA2/NAM7 helicase-like C-terminal domain-containing protein n=1 Tax=Podospora fimiseda TaxID=252190 RepID=A0AAN7BFU0_9PEZI|nr:hypothetical protein QBC38DRAFT_490978 [Podospora fimiseda]
MLEPRQPSYSTSMNSTTVTTARLMPGSTMVDPCPTPRGSLWMTSCHKRSSIWLFVKGCQAAPKLLTNMDPAATVDLYQGRERDFIIAIMGTAEESSLGFTKDENRLNVLLTRHCEGLVVVGDFIVASPDGSYFEG